MIAAKADHTPSLHIRQSTVNDIPRILEIFASARKLMADTGNPNQWEASYPSEDLICEDICSGDSHVIVNGGKIVGTFLLRAGADPTYAAIYGGAWLNDHPYATIHRIAGSGEVKGLFHIAMQFALQHYDDIRIDTHRDNIVMQKAIAKEGFSYCGIIHCRNGHERLAYQFSKHI